MTYFGYGSLVNIDTLNDGTKVSPGCLAGWVREWRIRGTNKLGRGVCSLSVARSPMTTIRGVSATEPKEGLKQLDQREWKYHRVSGVGPDFKCDEHGRPGAREMFLYRSRPEHDGWGSADFPIPQSYVDCVLAGFHAFWGEQGIRHFIDTTRGWHVPVLVDREAPIYPRAVRLTPDVLEMIDDNLSDKKVRYLAPS